MKRMLLLLMVGFGLSLNAQTDEIVPDADHYVVKVNGDTIFGKLKYASSDDIKNKITVKVNDTLKYSLKASEIVYFKDGDKEYVTFQPEGEEGHYFLKIWQLGTYLSLYEWQVPADLSGAKVEFYPYIRKKGEKTYTELETHWAKHLVEFIDEYEELADEVWKNKYKYEQMGEIVKKYNEWKEDNK
jgi:hypothetical protein